MEKKETKTEFFHFLQELVKQQDTKLTDLCEGLCSLSTMDRIEEGLRAPREILQEALLSRLGICTSDYEVYLRPQEYECWLERQEMRTALEEGEYEKLEKQLEAYRKKYNSKGDQLEQQFYWSLKAQMMRNTGATKETLGSVFEMALRLTVPSYGTRPLNKLCLSLQELNLILEYIYYGTLADRLEKADELIDYVMSKKMDTKCKARIYPKLAVYLCPLKLEACEGEMKEVQCGVYWDMLELMQSAVAALRGGSYIYYLWELLEVQKDVLAKCRDRFEAQLEDAQKEQLEIWQEENAIWRSMLEGVERITGYAKETQNDAPVLSGCIVSNLGEVVRRRRKMLGMRIRDLCEGICDLKTVSRLETGKSGSMREITYQLLERMGLPPSYSWNDMLMSSPIALEDVRQLRRASSRYQEEQMEQLIEKLEQEVPSELPWNRQYLEWYRQLLRRYRRELDKETYREELWRLFEYTLPRKALKAKEWYLPEREWKMLFWVSVHEDQKTLMNWASHAYKELERFEARKMVSTAIAMYRWLIYEIIHIAGEREDAEMVDMLCQKCIRALMLSQYCYGIDGLLYFQLWAQKRLESKKAQTGPANIAKGDVELCRSLADFFGITNYVDFYDEVLQQNS